MPSERDLALEMGVSRTVIREALDNLRIHGLIEQRNRAHYVADLDHHSLLANMIYRQQVEPEFITDLLEVRELLEVFIARKAAINAENSDIEAMQQAIQDMSILVSQKKPFFKPETDFHNALVRAAKNEVLATIFHVCADLLEASGIHSLAVATEYGIAITAMEEHQDILNAIIKKDSKLAADTMKAHLAYASKNILLWLHEAKKHNQEPTENK